MKTIILSLALLLAILLNPASAQIVNGYNANENADFHPGKGNVTINVQYVDPVKDVTPSHAFLADIHPHPQKHIAKYISPLGNLFKHVNNGNQAGTTPANHSSMMKNTQK